MKLSYIIAIFIIFTSINSYSQFNTNYRVAGGIVTTQILGDNPAKLPIIDTSPNDDAITGGSFPDAQPGVQLQFLFPVDEAATFRIPFSFKYFFFRGKERVNYNRNIIDYYSHTLNVASINSGLHYVFLPVKFARANVYTGIELEMSYIHNIDIEWNRDYKNNDVFQDEIYKIAPKDDAMRIGALLKLGVEGRLRDNFYINAGGAIGFMNIIGKNNNRGELLTPITMFETQESNILSLQVFILIQYNL
ncbi:MAG TPA: hypothetical protein PLE30_06210 [Candidatus Kapabacteria bacterium]|nr:hypothetical protein [Candidatus Kapabacteria bacterium]